MFEAAAYLLDVVHAEKDIESAVDVGIEFCGAIDRLVAQREVERHQAVIAPVPGVELFAHVLREQVFAGHSHSGGRVDGTGNEAATFDRAAIREAYAGGAAVRTTTSLTSAPMITEPPHASITRASASVKLADPPTGSVNSMTLAKMSGKTIPAPGTLSVVMTCM